jgi:hypothetical protein
MRSGSLFIYGREDVTLEPFVERSEAYLVVKGEFMEPELKAGVGKGPVIREAWE